MSNQIAKPLFAPLKIREFEFKNRIFVSPMCQYSAIDGVPNDWHLVHLGSRAVGGAALVIAEATAVSPIGRISPADTGIWNDEQLQAFARIVKFIHEQKSLAGVQLAHAGRKASTPVPWRRNHDNVVAVREGGWQPVAPSALPFGGGGALPKELTKKEIGEVVDEFVAAARRADAAGFDVVELHMAHGYLLHEFLSPLSNVRGDEYGGSLENRMRLPLEVATGVRAVWPAGKPLFVRLSATDWCEGGWDLPQSVSFSRELKSRGVDLIDCSSGGLSPHQKIEIGPGYQVPFAEVIRREAGILTGAVGLITDPRQANEILERNRADAVLLAREFLRDPYFPLHAAGELDAPIEWPVQYERAKN